MIKSMTVKLPSPAVSLLIVFTLALAFAGCARPPEEERAAAYAAKAAALAAGADKYAAKDYEAALQLWQTADSETSEKKYDQAKQDYINAKAAFAKSASGVEAVKKDMLPEAQAAVARLEEGWQNLEMAAKKIESKLGNNKRLWETDANSFLEGLKAAKEMVATDPAGVKLKADHLQRFIDTYSIMFKQMAAAPAKPPVARRKAGSLTED